VNGWGFHFFLQLWKEYSGTHEERMRQELRKGESNEMSELVDGVKLFSLLL